MTTDDMEERRLSTAGESLYLTLGVTRTATVEEVRRAYRRQALLYHPDKNAGDPAAAEKFQEVNRAYAVLSDTRQRQVCSGCVNGWYGNCPDGVSIYHFDTTGVIEG